MLALVGIDLAGDAQPVRLYVTGVLVERVLGGAGLAAATFHLGDAVRHVSVSP